MSAGKPSFDSVVDLGLRDVGVKNDVRGLAARIGRMSLAAFALIVLTAIAVCATVVATGAPSWLVVSLPLVWAAGLFVLALRVVRRSAPVVVRVTADGTNHATWLVIAPMVLIVLAAVVSWDPVLIPAIALNALMSLLLLARRNRVPEILSKVGLLLASHEAVLGDGVGVARRPRRRNEALRLIVATDRRLLVAPSTRSPEPFPLIDLPYARVSRFGIEWKYRGRVGELSLTVEGADRASGETHVITSITPANLVSIAQALQAHGVHTDDPAAVAEAAGAWEEARRRREPKQRLLDRAAMGAREFDHALWLLLALSTATFYVNPFGVGLGPSRAAVPVLAVVPVICAVCGYMSRTRSSLAYVAPLNLLVAPAFFVVDAGEVIAVMLVLSLLAGVGLWVGSALRRGAVADTGPARQVPRGSLRYAISGVALVRISAVLVAGLLTLVVTAGAAGFELSNVGLGVQEATSKQLPADGRSNLTGNAASVTYTPGPGLKELVTDENFGAGPNDGARWELRPSFTKGYNVVSLAHYIFDEPRLDDPAAIAEFVAAKDREHTEGAGFRVTHSRRVIAGRTAYVWTYGEPGRYWYYAAWFPQPVHSVRLECVGRSEMARIKRLCGEAIRSLRIR